MKPFRIILWLLSFGAWTLLLVLTHLPARYAHLIPPSGLKPQAEHGLTYALLGGLLSASVWATFPRWAGLIWIVLPILMTYGADDEQTQKLLGRECKWNHWLADCAGAAAAVTVTYGLSALSRPRTRLPRADKAPLNQRRRRVPRDRPPALRIAPLSNYLGSEVEAALSSLGTDDGLEKDEPIRVEKARAPSSKTVPVRAIVRRRMLSSE